MITLRLRPARRTLKRTKKAGCAEAGAALESQVEREMADGTTRTETQRMVRVGDEWKVETGGSVRVMTMPGGASGVLMESGGGGAPGTRKFEMRIEQQSAPVKP